jgi:RNA polymerase sigma-70 factor (ECF subfamily)
MTIGNTAVAFREPTQADANPEPRDLTPRRVAEEGAQLVPNTLRYLGVPDGSLMDAVQDVFLVALSRLGDFEGRSSLRTWLYGISVKVAHGHRRRAKSRRESLVERLPEVPTPAPQETELERAESRQVLNALLDGLDDRQRAVFVLYEIERLPMRQVADALACPLQTAYFRHKSAKKRILAAVSRSRRMEEEP